MSFRINGFNLNLKIIIFISILTSKLRSFLISNLRSNFVRKLITSFDKYDQGLEKYHNNQKSKFKKNIIFKILLDFDF